MNIKQLLEQNRSEGIEIRFSYIEGVGEVIVAQPCLGEMVYGRANLNLSRSGAELMDEHGIEQVVQRAASRMQIARRELENDRMPMFEVWAEGYEVTGNNGGVTCLGVGVKAETFKDACCRLLGSHPHFKNEEFPTYWGCRLFESKEKAQAGAA